MGSNSSVSKTGFTQTLKPGLLPPHLYTRVKSYHPSFSVQHKLGLSKVDLSKIKEVKYVTEYTKIKKYDSITEYKTMMYQINDGEENHIIYVNSDFLRNENAIKFLVDFSILLQLQHFNNNVVESDDDVNNNVVDADSD